MSNWLMITIICIYNLITRLVYKLRRRNMPTTSINNETNDDSLDIADTDTPTEEAQSLYRYEITPSYTGARISYEAFHRMYEDITRSSLEYSMSDSDNEKAKNYTKFGEWYRSTAKK